MNHEKMLQLLCQVLINPLPVELLVEQFEPFSQANWGRFLKLAERHGLLSILYQRIKNLEGQITIPADHQNHLHQAYVKLIARNLRMMNQTAQVLTVLKENNLAVIGLKGIYLLENVYDNIGLRTISDIDLLAKKEALDPVIACLQDLGYQRKTWFDPQDDNRDIMHTPPLVNKDGLVIELHWRISFEEDPFTFDIDGLWARAVPAKIAGEEGLALCTEDLILHLCFHTNYHHALLIGFRDLYDIREVIQQRQDQIDWPALIQRAQAAGAERVLALTFSLLERVLVYQVPDPSAARLSELVDPDVLNQALSLLFYQPTVTYPVRTEHIAKFLSAKGLKERARLILDRFLLPKQEMARRYDVSPHSLRIYCYYPVRLVEFIRKNTGVVKGFLRRGVSQDQVDQGTGEFFAHEEQEQQLKDWLAQQ